MAHRPAHPDILVTARQLTVCHECDLLMEGGTAAAEGNWTCPRCGSPLASSRPDALRRTLAAVASGLIFFAPAVLLPLLRLNIAGSETAHSLAGTVGVLASGGQVPVAIMVLICGILAPLAGLGLMFTVLVQVALKRVLSPLPRLLRWARQVDAWAMIDVYMIGILISVIKLKDMAKVESGVGLVCFVGLLAAILAVKTNIDSHDLWRRIEDLCGC